MKKSKLLKSNDGRCTYCKSDDVVRVGRISDARPSSTSKLPKLNKTIWRCRKCDTVYRYERE